MVLVGDIPSCFQSIAKERVETSLLLPKQVTRALLTEIRPKHRQERRPNRRRHTGEGSPGWASSKTWALYGAGSCADVLSGKFGILAGLPLAAPAAEAVLAPLLFAIEAAVPGAIAAIWVDNLIVMLPRSEDEETARAAISAALRDAICEQSLAEFHRRIKPHDKGKGFDMLGFRIRVERGGVHLSADEKFWIRLRDRLGCEMAEFPERFDPDTLAQRVCARVAHYNAPEVIKPALQAFAELLPLVGPELPYKHVTVESEPTIQVFTDGSCLGSPGPGGWAALIVPPPTDGVGTQTITLSGGGGLLATGNMMELKAVVEGLAHQRSGTRVLVHSDSRYVVENATKSLARWRRSGWRRVNGKLIAHAGLWKELCAQTNRLSVQFHWVRAHSGVRHNELADQAARSAMLKAAAGGTKALARAINGSTHQHASGPVPGGLITYPAPC